MNKYIKPTIKLASTASARSTASSCSAAEDMDLIQEIIAGTGADPNTVFNSNEGCQTPIELDMYCKFTSAETGATQIFWS